MYMNKTSAIKKIIGTHIKEYGFEFLRHENKIIWIFSRIIDGVEEHIIIQQHKRDVSEYKLMLSTTAMGNGRKEIGDLLPEYKDKEYWKAENDEEFISVISFFSEVLTNKGIKILDDMLTEKPDSFETPERKEWFKEHRTELLSKYEDQFHILENGSSFEQLYKIDEVLYANRFSEDDKESADKVYELILGMAAILCEIILKENNATIVYDTYFVEARIPFEDRYWSSWPVHEIAQAWIRYHNGAEIEKKYVWGRFRSFIRDSTVRMEEKEFKEYVARIINQSGYTAEFLSNNDDSGADYYVGIQDRRILIKCVYTDSIVDIKQIKNELNSMKPRDKERIILVLNQDITDRAIRSTVNSPNRTDVVTCRNTYSLKSMIINWLQYSKW